MSTSSLRPRFFPQYLELLNLSPEEIEQEYAIIAESLIIRPPPSKDTKLNVLDFLSNNGKTTSLLSCYGQRVPVEDLHNLPPQNLLICCVFLPMRPSALRYWLSIRASCNELSRSSDFCMVLVPVTEMDLDPQLQCQSRDKDEALFSDFVSETVSTTYFLTIPFSEIETRYKICSFIGLNTHVNLGLGCIVLDRCGRIVNHGLTHKHFLYYGSEPFPFHDRQIMSVDALDEVFRCRLDPLYFRQLPLKPSIPFEEGLCLGDILDCRPSVVLSRCCPNSGPSLTLSELSNKYVGLYICHSMEFFRDLCHAYLQCKTNGQELEIIVIDLGFLHMTTFQQRRRLPFYGSDAAESWFSFDHAAGISLDDSIVDQISRKVWRRFGFRAARERFIIVPPNGKYGELEGRTLIEQEHKYPFTRSTILERSFKALRLLNPTSWFKGADEKHTCLFYNNLHFNVPQSLVSVLQSLVSVPQSRVSRKKLLLYLDSPGLRGDSGKLFYLLVNYYSLIKARGWEVVFIPWPVDEPIVLMPWPIMPPDLAAQTSAYEQLFVQCVYYYHENYLIAVDETGKIVSRQAKKRLEEHGVVEYLFNDTLYEEVADHLSVFVVVPDPTP